MTTTTLHIDALEQVASMHSGTLPRLTVRRHEGTEPPPAADVLVVVSRSVPAHLLRAMLAEAAERLCADTGPRLRPPPRRVA